MSTRSFRSPFVALILAALSLFVFFIAVPANADDAWDGDEPDPGSTGHWSHADPNARVSAVVPMIWFDLSSGLVWVF
jgi:hypothetical protein